MVFTEFFCCVAVRTAPSASARRSRDEERTVPTNRDPLPDLVTSLRHLAPSAMPTVHHTITGIISRADDSTCCEGDGNEIIKVDISNSHFGFVVLESRIQVGENICFKCLVSKPRFSQNWRNIEINMSWTRCLRLCCSKKERLVLS